MAAAAAAAAEPVIEEDEEEDEDAFYSDDDEDVSPLLDAIYGGNLSGVITLALLSLCQDTCLWT